MAVRSKRQSKRLVDVGAFVEVAECLRALEHPVRLRMVQFLLHGRYTVGDIAEDCKAPGNVASENMRLLQRFGFWAIEREARNVFCQIAVSHLADLMNCIRGRFLNADSEFNNKSDSWPSRSFFGMTYRGMATSRYCDSRSHHHWRT